MSIFRGQLLIVFACCAFSGSGFAVDVLTYHNDNARTGLNSEEPILTLQNVNVNSFGLIRNLPVDGAVFAQPLYVSNAQVISAGQSQGPHNLIIVATEHDSVYAFDADSGTLYWQVSMLGTGEVPSDGRGCADLPTENGVTSTPVIDRAMGSHGVIYVLAMSETADGAQYFERLHALDLATGQNFLAPVTIQASYPGQGPGNDGNGNVIFNPAQQRGRAGLLLTNGTIYTEWGSFCDFSPFTGWIIAYNERTLAQTLIFNTDPNGIPSSADLPDGSGSGVWQAGQPPAVDSSGNLYFATGNGPFDTNLDSNGFPVSRDYGDTLLKVTPGLQVTNYFTPSDQLSLALNDGDFGSGGTLVLDITDSNNTVHHLAIAAGKDSNIYVVNRDNMGGFNSQGNHIYQVLTSVLAGGVWSSPAYFNGSIYYDSQGHSLLQFKFTSNATLNPVPVSASTALFPFPGGTPSISSLGSTNGIVWIKELRDGQVILHAYDSTNLANELYSSAGVNFGAPTKFGPPTVCNGKVFVGTMNSVGVFGLLNSTAIPNSPGLNQVFPAADLNGDGRSDLVLFNQAKNEAAVWLMSGNTLVQGAVVGNGPLNSRIAAVADLQNTGRAQIIWYNGSARYGTWSVAWSANSPPTTTGTWFLLPANYPVLVCADLDGDGLVDVVQFNPADGALLIAKNNGSLSFTTQFSTTVTPGWGLIGAADLNGTGQPQLIWRKAGSGQVAVWVFSTSQAFTPVHFPVFASPALDWSIRGIGQVDSTSAEGLIWRNAQTGSVAFWKMNTNGSLSATTLPPAGAGWQIAANAFFDGSGGNPEILWTNQQTGAIAVWRVNGSAVTGATISTPGTSWIPQPITR
jgi:FG-GAP-like repeat